MVSDKNQIEVYPSGLANKRETGYKELGESIASRKPTLEREGWGGS